MSDDAYGDIWKAMYGENVPETYQGWVDALEESLEENPEILCAIAPTRLAWLAANVMKFALWLGDWVVVDDA